MLENYAASEEVIRQNVKSTFQSLALLHVTPFSTGNSTRVRRVNLKSIRNLSAVNLYHAIENIANQNTLYIRRYDIQHSHHAPRLCVDFS